MELVIILFAEAARSSTNKIKRVLAVQLLQCITTDLVTIVAIDNSKLK
jgi:hypothetical protein